MKRLSVFLAAALCALAASAAPTIPPWGLDLGAIDRSVKPGDDFFQYVNGNWYKTAVIPDNYFQVGALGGLNRLSEKRIQDMAAALDATPDARLSPEERKLRDLYNAFTDTAKIEAAGLAPAQKDLDRIANLQTLDDVAAAMGDPRLNGNGIFIAIVGADEKTPTHYNLELVQGGLGLPDRLYYENQAKSAVRNAYKTHLKNLFTLLGKSDAQDRADAVDTLEKQIADVSVSGAELRDPAKIYNPTTYSALKTLAPEFPWDSYMRAMGLGSLPQDHMINLFSKASISPLAKLFAATPVSVWRDLLTVHYLHNYAAFLPRAYDDEDFAFYGRVMTGTPAQYPRGVRAARMAEKQMPDAVGRLYVARYFPPASKAKATAMASNITAVFISEVATRPWLTPQTRATLAAKLKRLTIKIGYPDHWRDYSALVIKRDDPLGNMQRISAFEWDRQLHRIDRPVDRGEWALPVPNGNSYENAGYNEVVFPAGIIQSPEFDPAADDAVNYGAFGATLAESVSFAADEPNFDADGNAGDWWTSADHDAYTAEAQKLDAQYATYEPLPGKHINARSTEASNIGDTAGLAVALKAYHLSLKGKPAPVLGGFTGDQRLFMAYAQMWRAKTDDRATDYRLTTGIYSPEMYRAIGPVRNIDEWYDAFNVQPGDKYYLPPEQRAHFW